MKKKEVKISKSKKRRVKGVLFKKVDDFLSSFNFINNSEFLNN